MEDRELWRRMLTAAFGYAVLTLGCAGSVHAEMLVCSTVCDTNREVRPHDQVDRWFEPASARKIENAVSSNERLSWRGFQAEYEDWKRSVVETMLTTILIKWGTPPPPPAGQNEDIDPPPQGEGEEPPPPPPPPPPPDGGGEEPPDGPPIDPPPQSTPEPTSLLIAGIGVGLTSLVSWRRRMRRPANA